jgi:hypothetical protein
VRVEGAPDDWLDAVPGARRSGDLVEGAPPGAVLDAARGAGEVAYFARVRPTLAELFREAVAPGAGGDP